MDRIEYTECMKPHMSGEGKTKEERQRAMCIGAKLCTGKASNKEEANKICESLPPKQPKQITGKKPRISGSCASDMSTLAECATKYLLEGDEIISTNLITLLTNALYKCGCRISEAAPDA